MLVGRTCGAEQSGGCWGHPKMPPYDSPLCCPPDHKAFYVIISWENGAQIYELVAQTVSERKK